MQELGLAGRGSRPCGESKMEKQKRPYKRPVVETMGSFERLTQAAEFGSKLDGAFTACNPLDEFSPGGDPFS